MLKYKEYNIEKPILEQHFSDGVVGLDKYRTRLASKNNDPKRNRHCPKLYSESRDFFFNQIREIAIACKPLYNWCNVLYGLKHSDYIMPKFASYLKQEHVLESLLQQISSLIYDEYPTAILPLDRERFEFSAEHRNDPVRFPFILIWAIKNIHVVGMLPILKVWVREWQEKDICTVFFSKFYKMPPLVEAELNKIQVNMLKLSRKDYLISRTEIFQMISQLENLFNFIENSVFFDTDFSYRKQSRWFQKICLRRIRTVSQFGYLMSFFLEKRYDDSIRTYFKYCVQIWKHIGTHIEFLRSKERPSKIIKALQAFRK